MGNRERSTGMTNDLEFFKAFLDGVGVFFTLYLIGYSTCLLYTSDAADD